jgi:hypothetical protein
MNDDLSVRIRELEAQLEALKAEVRRDDSSPTRRGMLRAAAVGVAGAVGATVAGRPAAAATGGNVVLGQANTASAVTTLRNDAPATAGTGGPVAMRLDSNGAHLQFSSIAEADSFGRFPNGTLAYFGADGLHIVSDDTWVRIASGTTVPMHLLPAAVRIYDSRSASGSGSGELASGESRGVNVTAAGAADLPRFFGEAVMLNLTVISTEGNGWLTVGPSVGPNGNTNRPPTSNINWTAPGQVVANLIVTRLHEGNLTVWAGGNGAAHFILDITAFYG